MDFNNFNLEHEMNHKSNFPRETTAASDNSTPLCSAVLLDGDLTLRLPLHYNGGDLGLGSRGRPWIYFSDDSGKRFLTHSVEWLLKNIECFAEGRCRVQPLACAAVHYGLDAYALIGRSQLCDVRKSSGEILLADVSHEAASWARDEYMARSEWTDRLHVRFLGRFGTSTRDNRHDGPLILLPYRLMSQGGQSVPVRSHTGCSRIKLEEALLRIDQFSHAHQTEILIGLRNRDRKMLTPLQRVRQLKTRPTKMQ